MSRLHVPSWNLNVLSWWTCPRVNTVQKLLYRMHYNGEYLGIEELVCSSLRIVLFVHFCAAYGSIHSRFRDARDLVTMSTPLPL
jgi:hypothetical protein